MTALRSLSAQMVRVGEPAGHWTALTAVGASVGAGSSAAGGSVGAGSSAAGGSVGAGSSTAGASVGAAAAGASVAAGTGVGSAPPPQAASSMDATTSSAITIDQFLRYMVLLLNWNLRYIRCWPRTTRTYRKLDLPDLPPVCAESMAGKVHAAHRSKPWTCSEKPDAQKQGKGTRAGAHTITVVREAKNRWTRLCPIAQASLPLQRVDGPPVDAEAKNAHAGAAEILTQVHGIS